MLTGYEPVPTHFKKYTDYIKNTGQSPLPGEAFDDDWSPIGPMVRDELIEGGFIYYDDEQLDGILLRPDLA